MQLLSKLVGLCLVGLSDLHGLNPGLLFRNFLEFFLCHVMHHSMSPQALLHGEALAAAGIHTAKGLLALMVSQYVTLQVEGTREPFPTTLLWAQQLLLRLLPSVDTQPMLVQEPCVVKQLLTLATLHLDFVFFPVLQIFCPSISLERTGFLLTLVTSMYFLMTL